MTDPRPPFTLRKSSRFALLSAPFVIAAGLWAAPGLVVYDTIKVVPPATAVAATEATPDGRALFVTHCARCHGETGDGKGLASLNPTARHFGYEAFKFATTKRRQVTGHAFANPTDEDLLAVLRRGIPGSSMPAFQKPAEGTPPISQVQADLTDGELKAVVGHVRHLTRRGVYEKLHDRAVLRELKAVTDETKDHKAVEVADADAAKPPDKQEGLWRQARAAADKPALFAADTEALTAPGEPVSVPAQFEPRTPDALANGKRLFVKALCASCHGESGRGDGEKITKVPAPGAEDDRPRNEDGTLAAPLGTLAFPRDLTAGIYKGGGDMRSLYTRIRLGIPGTPMPASEATALSEIDVADLIHYVQSLRGK